MSTLWDPNNRNHRDIHVSLLSMVECEGLHPEEVKSIALNILEGTIPELFELYQKQQDRLVMEGTN